MGIFGVMTHYVLYEHYELYGVMKHYSPNGRRNHGRLLKRLLDTWDRNGSHVCNPTPWQIYDDDDDDDGDFWNTNICHFDSLYSCL